VPQDLILALQSPEFFLLRCQTTMARKGILSIRGKVPLLAAKIAFAHLQLALELGGALATRV